MEPPDDPIRLTDREVETATVFDVPAWRPTGRRRRDRITLGLLALSVMLGLLGTARGRATRWAGNTSVAAVILGTALAVLTVVLRGLPFAQLRYEISELNEPPQQEVAVPVPGHGRLRRGRTAVPSEDDTTRPYLWLWLEPHGDNECGPAGTYRWYQFVRPRFSIDGHEKRLRRGIEGATGRRYRFGEWNPDYHVEETSPDDPAFRPDEVAPADPGKPYKRYPIPGTSTAANETRRRLTGILDAPNFCSRSERSQAPIERLLGRFMPTKELERPTRPAGQDVTVEVTVEARSYLVCVRENRVECIGYVTWEYTNEALVRLVCQERGIAAGANKRREVGSELVRCEHRLTIGDWTMPC